MKSKSKGALFLTGGVLLIVSIIVFILSFNNEFMENSYRFDFGEMGRPERALIGIIICIALLLPAIFIKTKDE